MIRPYTPRDYSTIAGWADARHLPAPPVAMLPKHGVISYRFNDSDILAAAWVYLDTYAGVGFPHWLMTAPNLPLKTARESVGEILDALKEIAKEEGIHTLITTTCEEGITREAINQFRWQYIGTGSILYLECN